MPKQPQSRLLSDLPLDELRRALAATEAAVGRNSYSAECLRQAITSKRQKHQRAQKPQGA